MTTISEIEKISPEGTLEACARQVIVSYFREMMSHMEGAKAGIDIEFVHDIRVASRRLSAAMENFAGCFPEKPFKKYYKKVKAITRTMGAVRDLDVLIARFQRELVILTEVEQIGIRGVIEHLQREWEDARKPMLVLFEKLETTNFETEFLKFFVEDDF